MRVISIRKEKILMVIYGILIAGGLVSAYFTESAPAFAMPVSKKVVVIDAGHGGWDPGTVRDNVLEKDINLSIAQKLQAYLEEGGATVLITRLDDAGLADTKAGDMRMRRQISNTGHADIVVSIHQNSLGNTNIKGAQVFYYNQSDSSKKLSDFIQQHLIEFVDPNNRLQPKANDNYYILKQTAMPAVIVECGFLSNPGERSKLVTESYQERIAWGIYMGIVDYFNAE
jgi:N-acetylmuramoyl-L-alanine amidase